MTTIIIDDDVFVHKLLTRQLGSLGEHDVTCFEHAQDALDFVQSYGGADTLIFCDLQMPGLDGVEIVRHLAAGNYPGALVLVSGEDERVLQTAALLANARQLNLLGTLFKPVILDQLKQLLAKHVAPQTAPQPRPREPRKNYSADDLRHAIENDQLLCYFQPKVRANTGEVLGAESLVRWRHPEDGMIYPDQFIALAETSGLIDALTQFVLQSALAQTRHWHDTGLPLSVSVNVSMKNLTALSFPDQVTKALTAAGLPPEKLILECTESQVMQDRMSALDIFTRLRLKHIGLSIDDLGTGHSSLAQLRDLPFTELKIDRGFVNGAAQDPARRKIFDACLRVGRDLGLSVVAEGAEDLDDWRFLCDAGCDIIQGYFVARPMAGAELPNWITDWSQRYKMLQHG
jgi:EAL domain-containing protein (putative c-di-GMP-specific phosphodiesterase class I)/CheY-like chemotaxis protein